MKHRMIFHYPNSIYSVSESGSGVRPYRILKAFQALGYDVSLISGIAKERHKAIKCIKEKILNGENFDFIYSESSSMPTLLTQTHHFPSHPFLDFAFLKWARNRRIPIGLFYRDIYWRFREYKLSVKWYKRAVSIPLYRYDLFQYSKIIDTLFLPSTRMLAAIPLEWPVEKVSVLPPGCESCDTGVRLRKAMDFSSRVEIKLFYVGGITPPLYDMGSMFKIPQLVSYVKLTVCCRRDEWELNRNYYQNINLDNVCIVHESGAKLKELYLECDIFALIRPAHPYLDFAMPVKIFEALGHGCPILTLRGNEGARFVEEEGVGWCVDSLEDVTELLSHLRKNPNEIGEKQRFVEQRAQVHTWQKRAQTVANILMKER